MKLVQMAATQALNHVEHASKLSKIVKSGDAISDLLLYVACMKDSKDCEVSHEEARKLLGQIDENIKLVSELLGMSQGWLDAICTAEFKEVK